MENNNINLNTFQFVSVDNANIQIPPQIQSVPALIMNGEIHQGAGASRVVQQIVHNIQVQRQQQAAMQQQQQFAQNGMGQMMGSSSNPAPGPRPQPQPEQKKEPDEPEGICEFEGGCGTGGCRLASADDKAVNVSDNTTYSFINGEPDNKGASQQAPADSRKQGVSQKQQMLDDQMEKLMAERNNFTNSMSQRPRPIV